MENTKRFVIQPSKNIQGGWVATDTHNGIVVTFQAHRFNDTQHATLLADKTPDALTIATAMQQLGDWLRENHYDKIF